MGNSVSKHHKQSTTAIASSIVASAEYATQNGNSSTSNGQPTGATNSGLTAVGVVAGANGQEEVALYQTKLDASLELITKDLFSKVTSCTLNNLQLTTFPRALLSLRQLASLEVSHNELTCIPKQISSLTKLKRLVAMHNKIEFVHQGIGDLGLLVFIELSHNRLQQLPLSFHKLSRLSGLGLSDNLFAEFPAQICQLYNLTQLGFHTNRVSVLPREISNLRKLKKLDISKNGLECIPDSFSQLESLEWLNLGHNSIRSLPGNFADLAHLEDIGLAHNRLDTIQWFSGMTALKSLIIYDNRLTFLSGGTLASLTNLQVLEASMNEIRYFPAELLHLPKLQKINLQRNKISTVHVDPYRQPSASINTILLQYNLIESLPKEFIPLIERLDNFFISGNPLNRQPIFPNASLSLTEAALNALLNRIEQLTTTDTIPRASQPLHQKMKRCHYCQKVCVHEAYEFLEFRSFKQANGVRGPGIPFVYYVCNKTEFHQMLPADLIIPAPYR